MARDINYPSLLVALVPMAVRFLHESLNKAVVKLKMLYMYHKSFDECMIDRWKDGHRLIAKV